MVEKVHRVVFFGTIVATVIGQEIYDKFNFEKLESERACVKFHLGVSSGFGSTQEVLGCTSISGPYELHNEMDAAQLRFSTQYLTVMLECNEESRLETQHSNEECLDMLFDDQGSAETRLRSDATDVVLSVAGDLFCGECKHDLISTKNVELCSLARRAANDRCCVVRIIISRPPQTSSTGSLASHQPEIIRQSAGDDENAVAAIYVMLRVVDLSRNLSNALDADTQFRRQMRLPQLESIWDLSETRKTKVPYGVMPLSELYDQYRHFFSKYWSVNIRSSKGVVQTLQAAYTEANTPYPYRWNRLTEVCLDRLFLGEKGFAPVLLTLSHSSNLSCLIADGNGIGDVPCAWLFALFRQHRYLHTLCFSNNNIYEGGADQLLRLARRNPQITKVELNGNCCSQFIMQRIERVTRGNLSGIQSDPLNLLSPAHSEVVTPASIPVPVTMFALEAWSMLSAAPVGDIDVWVRNSTTTDMDQYEDSSIAPRREAFEAAQRAPAVGIPRIAYAPLLNEIIRTVYVGIAAAIEDPVVRSVFMDVQTLHLRRKDSVQKIFDKLNSSDANAPPNSSLHENGESTTSPMEEEQVLGPNDPLPSEIKRVLEKSTYHKGGTEPECLAWLEVEEEIYQSSFLNIIVTTFRGLTGTISWADVVQILQRIGKQQRELGVQDEDYWLAANLFMKSLQISLGNEERAAKMLSGFLTVLVLAVRTAVAWSCVGKG